MCLISLLYWFYGNHAAFWSYIKPSIFSKVYLTFWVPGPRIYALQTNEDHCENHKETLNKTGGGDFSKKNVNFKCIGSFSSKQGVK